MARKQPAMSEEEGKRRKRPSPPGTPLSGALRRSMSAGLRGRTGGETRNPAFWLRVLACSRACVTTWSFSAASVERVQ